MSPRALTALLLAAPLLGAGCQRGATDCPPAASPGPAGPTGPLGAIGPATPLLAHGVPPRPPTPPTAATIGPPPLSSAGALPGRPPVRPPFRCVEQADLTANGLAREAEAALDAGKADRALGCADEALRADPRHLRALTARAEALVALKRVPEAQLALTRALALDPDDPWVLAAAADLHVRELGGVHDALEAGLAHALRGLRALTRVPRRDPDLALHLELSAAAALNDLGRSAEALPHADKAVALRKGEPAARSERGFALFELCRFEEARAAFEAVLAVSKEDAWALHQLGLLAERRGDEAGAARLLARARAASPAEFPSEVAVSREAFQAEVARAVAELSPEDRRSLGSVPVEAADLPALADLTFGDPPLSPSILGLFRGPPEGEACLPEDGDPCRSIVLYRRNLARFARDRAELDRQIRVTLVHELGHLRGEDDGALRDRGLE
jgi:tetratricopeptide (TPR) repeat protein